MRRPRPSEDATARRGGRSSVPPPAPGSRWSTRCCRRWTCRRTPRWPPCGSGSSGRCPRPSPARFPGAAPPERRSPGWPRTRSSTCARPSPPGTGCSSPRSRTPSGGRWCAAVRRAWPTRWWPGCAGPARRSSPGAGCATSASSRPHRVTVLDLTPRQVLEIAGDRLPPRYRRRLARYRYGPGVFKLDYALDGPVPWSRPGRRGRGHGPPGRHRGGGRRRRAGRGPRAAPGRARSCSASRPAWPTPRGPRRVDTPSGPTATCRTARTST